MLAVQLAEEEFGEFGFFGEVGLSVDVVHEEGVEKRFAHFYVLLGEVVGFFQELGLEVGLRVWRIGICGCGRLLRFLAFSELLPFYFIFYSL